MEQKIDKGIGWLDKTLQMVEKYKFKTIFKAVAVILIIAAVIGFLKNPTWIFEQYRKWEEDKHQEAIELRMQNNEKLHILTEKLMYRVGADRTMVLEMHNGLVGNGGLPFSKCSATYEAINEHINPIAGQYQGVNLSLIPFSHKLSEEGYWCGDIEDLEQYDRSLYYRMRANGCEHFAACVIEGIDKPLAFLFVSFNSDPEHDCQEVRENIRHVAMEMAVLMEVSNYVN